MKSNKMGVGSISVNQKAYRQQDVVKTVISLSFH